MTSPNDHCSNVHWEFDGVAVVGFRRMGQLASFARTSCVALGLRDFTADNADKIHFKWKCLRGARALLPASMWRTECPPYTCCSDRAYSLAGRSIASKKLVKPVAETATQR